MIIYPQFNPTEDSKSGESDYEKLSNLICLSIKEIENSRLNVFDYETFYHSSLGTVVADTEIDKIYRNMIQVAVSLGYPDSNKLRIKSDKQWAAILHQQMGITRNEASKAGVWNALSCHYMPNLVAWRWPEKNNNNVKAPSSRWITQDNRRHAFARLWWRAELLADHENKDDIYHLLDLLGEDEIADITERPSLASHNKLCLLIAKYQTKNKLEREIFRNALKIIGLRLGIHDIDALEVTGEFEKFINNCFADSI
jgi:hypothetical protein